LRERMFKRHESVLQDRLPCEGRANWSIHRTDLGRTALHTREGQGGRAGYGLSKTNAASESRGHPAWQVRQASFARGCRGFGRGRGLVHGFDGRLWLIEGNVLNFNGFENMIEGFALED